MTIQMKPFYLILVLGLLVSLACVCSGSALPPTPESDLREETERVEVETPELPAMPQELHLGDARTALNGLSSFQYVTTGEFESEGNATTIHCEGVYVQANQAWRADCRFAEEEEVLVQFYSVGDRTWWGAEGGMGWLPVSSGSSVEQTAGEAAPFAYWPDARHWQIGTLQPEPMRSIAGVGCYEYAFIPSDASEDVQLRLCVIPEGAVPIRMESSARGDNFTVLIIREFSRLDDPDNVVEPPADWSEE